MPGQPRQGKPPVRFPAPPDAPGAFSSRTWTRLAIVVGVALFLAILLENLLWQIAYPLGLIFAAAVIAQGLAPVAHGLSRWLPRPLAVALLYLALLALAVVGAWLFLPTLLAQARLIAAQVPDSPARFQEEIERLSPVAVQDIAAAVEDDFRQLTRWLVELPVLLFSAGTTLVLVIFLSLYWLIAQPSLRGWALGLVPEEQRDIARDVLTEVGETVGGYVRGVIISALAVTILTYIGLRLLGLPSPFVLAVLAGLGELIPVLGPFLAAIPAVGVALITGEQSVILVIAFYVGLQQVESNILLPLIMRGQARIPPLLSLVAFLFGAAVGNIFGALIAIPLFGALRVVVDRVLAPAERQVVGVSRAEAEAVHQAEEARETVGTAGRE